MALALMECVTGKGARQFLFVVFELADSPELIETVNRTKCRLLAACLLLDDLSDEESMTPDSDGGFDLQFLHTQRKLRHGNAEFRRWPGGKGQPAPVDGFQLVVTSETVRQIALLLRQTAERDAAGPLHEGTGNAFRSQGKAKIAVAKIAAEVHREDISGVAIADTDQQDGVGSNEGDHRGPPLEKGHANALRIVPLPLPVSVKQVVNRDARSGKAEVP